MRQTGYKDGRSGYIIDYVNPLACGGADDPSNMQWQTIAGQSQGSGRACRLIDSDAPPLDSATAEGPAWVNVLRRGEQLRRR
jgi:hypothetical protein